MVAASRARRRRSVLLIIVLTALTLITLDARGGRTGPLGFLGRAAHTVVSPIQGAVDDVASPVSDWWQGVTNSGDIKQENQTLKEDLAKAQGEARANAKAAAENEELRKQLGLTDSINGESVLAEIRGGEVGNFDPTFTINKGTRDGVAKDMPVISPAGLVGQVIEVWSNGAKVRTLTDPKFAIAVVTPPQGASRPVSDTANGTGGPTLEASFGAGTKLKVGDKIYSSALSSSFPPNIAVGTVSKVTESPGNTSVKVEITPFVNLDELQYLTVLKWHPGAAPPVTLPTTTSTTTTTIANPFGVTSTVP
jgi:rod shape-determining protein MreC